MTETTLNAVLKIDGQTKAFSPAAHNLTAQKAEAKVNELKGKGIEARSLPQGSHHKGRGVKSCELCKNAAQNLSEQDASELDSETEHDEQTTDHGKDG